MTLPPTNPQPGQYWKPGLRYRESMGGAIAAIHDLVVAGGGVTKYYPSNWGGLIAAIRDLGTTFGSSSGSGGQVITGVTPPGFTTGTPGGAGGVPAPINGGWSSNTPANGTLWFDERQGRLMVWAGNAFHQTNGAESLVHVGDTPPVDANGNPLERSGQLWFDTRQGRTFVYIVRGPMDKEWYQLNGGEGHNVFVEPHRLWHYASAPGLTSATDPSGTFEIITDATNELGSINIGDQIRGLTSNGGGIITNNTSPYILDNIGYNGALVPSEMIAIGEINTPGTPAGFTPTVLDPTLQFVFDATNKQLTFAAGDLPKEMIVGYYLLNPSKTAGGTVGRILDTNSDGIPDTVELSSQNFIGDLADNEDLTIQSYRADLAVIGDMWYRTDTAEIAVYDGTTWVVIGGSGGGSDVIVADTPPAGTTPLAMDATYGTSSGDGQLWYDSKRKVTYVSVNSNWEPITDRKYATHTISHSGAAPLDVYETTADKHGFFVDYVVRDDETAPTVMNGGRILVYHVGTYVCITNVMAQGIDTAGLDTQLGIVFEGVIDAVNNTFTLKCGCTAVLTNPPVIQIAVSNWVDPS